MRQVFSSPRLENVDGVEAFLHQHGIATHVSNRDKLRRDRFRRPSYSQPASTSSWPAVWVLQAEDLPRARQLLRDAGLMGSTRPDVAPGYNLSPRREVESIPTAARIRRILLALVLLSTGYFLWTTQSRPPPPPAARSLPATPPGPTSPDQGPNEVTPVEIIDPRPTPAPQ
ncbi:MAG: hypothetical protein AB7V26_05295 [Lysobacterales bacterium]